MICQNSKVMNTLFVELSILITKKRKKHLVQKSKTMKQTEPTVTPEMGRSKILFELHKLMGLYPVRFFTNEELSEMLDQIQKEL